ncbi:MAG: acetyltransferase [Nanoarchaeota archaeon]
MKRIIIYGASGHGRVVLDILRDHSDLEVVGFADDKATGECAGIPILGPLETVKRGQFDGIALGIGDNKARKTIFNQLTSQLVDVITAIHPKAHISASAAIGPGSVICAGAHICAHATIGENCIVNTAATIDHDCTVSAHCHISPNASLGGGCTVGEGTWIGLGSSIIHGISIGAWSIIGAGSAVIKNVPDHVMSAGNPAIIKKELK